MAASCAQHSLIYNRNAARTGVNTITCAPTRNAALGAGSTSVRASNCNASRGMTWNLKNTWQDNSETRDMTKTKYARTSYLPKGLTNEIKSLLKQKGFMSKRDEKIKKPDAYLFHAGRRWNMPYTENRIRQIFQRYINKAGLQQIYGQDTLGRNLKMFTVHSLRHTHVTLYVIDKKVPLPIVQKQVGHRSLKTTSVYLKPSTEKMAEAYRQARLDNTES